MDIKQEVASSSSSGEEASPAWFRSFEQRWAEQRQVEAQRHLDLVEVVQQLQNSQSSMEDRVTQQESRLTEVHQQVEKWETASRTEQHASKLATLSKQVEELTSHQESALSKDSLQKELQAFKEDMRGWTGITIAKRLEAERSQPQSDAREPGSSPPSQPEHLDNSLHQAREPGSSPPLKSSPLNQSRESGSSPLDESQQSLSQVFLGRHSPFHRLPIGDPKRQAYFPFIVIQPDRLTSLVQLQALKGVVEDRLEEGLQFKEYFDRAQVEILSEADKKEKVGGSQLKPSAVKLEKCTTASPDPSKPHELETFVANMKLLAINNYPLREWGRELLNALTLFTQECLSEIDEPLRSEVKSSPINLYAFLRFCRYTEAELLGVYYSKLPILTSASTSQDLFHSAEELARTFGVYSFEGLQTYLCTVVPDPATHHLIRQAGSRLELHKIVHAMSATTPGRTMSIAPEAQSDIRYRELDEVTTEECEQITRCLRVDNAPYELQCWECNGKGHGLMACPQLKSWSRQQKIDRIKQLRTMGKAPRRSKWQPADDSARQDQALVIGADLTCL
eukprot:Nk52_evm1s1898 gene=Nk52_evmTU1s1898